MGNDHTAPGAASELPELITPSGWWARLRYKECPACGALFPNGRCQMSAIGYPMHYAMEHLGIEVWRRHDQ